MRPSSSPSSIIGLGRALEGAGFEEEGVEAEEVEEVLVEVSDSVGSRLVEVAALVPALPRPCILPLTPDTAFSSDDVFPTFDGSAASLNSSIFIASEDCKTRASAIMLRLCSATPSVPSKLIPVFATSFSRDKTRAANTSLRFGGEEVLFSFSSFATSNLSSSASTTALALAAINLPAASSQSFRTSSPTSLRVQFCARFSIFSVKLKHAFVREITTSRPSGVAQAGSVQFTSLTESVDCTFISSVIDAFAHATILRRAAADALEAESLAGSNIVLRGPSLSFPFTVRL